MPKAPLQNVPDVCVCVHGGGGGGGSGQALFASFPSFLAWLCVVGWGEVIWGGGGSDSLFPAKEHCRIQQYLCI